MPWRWWAKWLIGGVVLVPLVFWLSRDAYFQVSGGDQPRLPSTPEAIQHAAFVSIYKSWDNAQRIYFGTLAAFYYGAYVTISLVCRKIYVNEARFHLAFWTLAPPLWFAFEWYFVFDQFDNPIAVEGLKKAQELASKLWAAVLAIMLPYLIGDIVKTDHRAEQTPDTNQNPLA